MLTKFLWLLLTSTFFVFISTLKYNSAPISFMLISGGVVFLLLSIMIFPDIIRDIRKYLNPFSGQIETFKDVNAFLVNYKYFTFYNGDMHGDIYDIKEEFYPDGQLKSRIKSLVHPKYYYIVTVNLMWYSNFDLSSPFLVPKGIYWSNDKNDDLRFFLKERYIPLRVFIWNHRDAINAELSRQKKESEHANVKAENIAEYKKQEQDIKKACRRG